MNEELRNRALWIVGAGAMGGFGAFLWAIFIGPAPLIDNPWLVIPGYMVLGAIAGFCGVYLIAKTDPSAVMHGLAFSLGCGLFWSPVIAGVEALVTRKQVSDQRDAVRQITERTKEIAAKLESESAAMTLWGSNSATAGGNLMAWNPSSHGFTVTSELARITADSRVARAELAALAEQLDAQSQASTATGD